MNGKSGYSFRQSSSGPVGTTSLQEAYENGNSINATAGEGDIDFTLTSADFNVNGPGAFAVGSAVDLSSIDLQASGAVTIDSSGGVIGMGTDANTGAINIGTGAAARNITIGNITGTSRTVINSGTGASSWTLTGAGTFDLIADTGAVNLASNATDHATVLGSTVGASPTTIRSGSSNLNLTSPNVVVGTVITIPNTGLHILDTDASHDLIIVPGSNLAADRTLTWTTGDVSRSVDITGAHGSVYFTNAAGNLVPLAPGVSGEFLRTAGAGADPAWATASVTVTLQQAYEGGNTINVTGADGPLYVTLATSDFQVEGPGGFYIGYITPVIEVEFDVTSYFHVIAGDEIQLTTTSGLEVTAATASFIEVDAGGLSISTLTSGAITVTSVGALDLSGTTGDWQASGALTLDSSGGAISIGSDANAFAINLGTGAAARDITIGNLSGTSRTVINSGTGSSSWTMTGVGTFSLIAGTGQVNIATNATDHATLLGSITGTSATTIRSGSGNLTLTSPDVIVGTVITVPNTGLHLLDTDASHDLIIVPGSNLAADRTLTLTTGDASRTVDLTGAQGAVYYTNAAGNLVPLAPGVLGEFLQTQGAGANPTWSSVPVSVTLQQAYDAGSTITVTAVEGDLAITLASADFTIDGPSSVFMGGNTPLGRFEVFSSSDLILDAAALLFDGTTTSHVSVTNAGLTLSTITSGTLAVTSAGALNLSGTTGDWQASGALTLDSSGGAISIGSDANAFAVNMGTGAAARDITIGNITGTSRTAINAGTGASSWTLTGVGTFDLVAGTGTVNLASNATDHSTLLGSTTGTSATTIQSGTGNLNLTSPNVIVGTVITVPNTGLHLLDTNASHDLIIAPGSDLGADRTLTLTTGDASRTIDLTGAQGAVYYTDASGNLVPLGPGTSGEFLKTQGAGANPIWDTASGPTKGTATADFGVSLLGTEYVEIVVIGQAGILAGADIAVTMMAEATADHNAYEASLIPVKLTAGDIVAGTGFTIRVFSDWLLNGTFSVRWSWSN